MIEKDLSFGQRACGVSFNPSNNPHVDTIKQKFADVIDYINMARDSSNDPEVKRMASVAITEAQTAQMWAVKAVTWNK
jgi:hypothetical protein